MGQRTPVRDRGLKEGRRRAERPFPLEALDDWLGRKDDAALAARLGMSRQRIAGWRQTGLTWGEADRVATQLGLHPSSLWTYWTHLHPSSEPRRAPAFLLLGQLHL